MALFTAYVIHNSWFFADAFDTEQLLECIEKLRCGQSVHVPIYDFKTHHRCSESFRQVSTCPYFMLKLPLRFVSFYVLKIILEGQITFSSEFPLHINVFSG